jgi:hypothetical protein
MEKVSGIRYQVSGVREGVTPHPAPKATTLSPRRGRWEQVWRDEPAATGRGQQVTQDSPFNLAALFGKSLEEPQLQRAEVALPDGSVGVMNPPLHTLEKSDVQNRRQAGAHPRFRAVKRSDK